MFRRAADAALRGTPGVRGMSFLTRLADGKLGEQTLRRSGTLIGTDQNGNKYYENRSYQVGRHRWAVFADPWNYSASSIPAGWHAWLCCIHDGAPSVHAYTRPSYELAPWDGRYGSSSHAGATALTPERDVHLPKGHVKRGGRSWARFQQWVPPAAAANQ